MLDFIYAITVANQRSNYSRVHGFHLTLGEESQQDLFLGGERGGRVRVWRHWTVIHPVYSVIYWGWINCYRVHSVVCFATISLFTDKKFA